MVLVNVCWQVVTWSSPCSMTVGIIMVSNVIQCCVIGWPVVTNIGEYLLASSNVCSTVLLLVN